MRRSDPGADVSSARADTVYLLPFPHVQAPPMKQGGDMPSTDPEKLRAHARRMALRRRFRLLSHYSGGMAYLRQELRRAAERPRPEAHTFCYRAPTTRPHW